MLRKLIAGATLVAFLSLFFGCATTNPNGTPPSPGQSAAGGAIAGALLGGAIGALCGLIPGGSIAASVARGAIAGASTGLIAGAIAGFAYGKYQEQQYRDRQAAEAFHQYKPEQGEKVIVEAIEVKPESSVQGGNISLNFTFSVLTGASEPVPVEVTQLVMVENKVCGQPLCYKSDRVSGTYVFSVPMTIPGDAPEGKYKLVTLVKTTKANDQKTCDFMVAKKPSEKTPETPASPEEKPAAPEKTEKTIG